MCHRFCSRCGAEGHRSGNIKKCAVAREERKAEQAKHAFVSEDMLEAKEMRNGLLREKRKKLLM